MAIEEKKINTQEARFDIPTLYRTQWITATLWGWITAQRQQGVTLMESARQFIQYMRIPHEDTEELAKNLIRTYHIKNLEVIQTTKTTKGVQFFNFTPDQQDTFSILEEIRETVAGIKTQMERNGNNDAKNSEQPT